MNKLLKQINDIQSQLNTLQGDLIDLLPAITFAEEMFSSRGLSDEETCSDLPSQPEAENVCVSSKLLKAKEEAETKSVTKRRKLQAKAEPAPELTPEPAPEPAPELTLQQSAEARSIADPTDEQRAEIIASTQKLIDETMELVAEKKAEKADTAMEPQSLEGATLSYDDFKNAIYAFIKEDTATNKPIVLGIFKERGYGFTSDVPETDYQLVLDLIKERG